MNNTSLNIIYDAPCRIKLKSGKEVYGVIWKEPSPMGDVHYFSSSTDYNLIKNLGKDSPNLKTPVNIEDVAAVELMQGILPGKDMFR